MQYMGGKSRISKEIAAILTLNLGGAKYICKPVLWVFLVMFGITILIISALVAFI